MKKINLIIPIVFALTIACNKGNDETTKSTSTAKSTAKNNTDFVGKWIAISNVAKDKNNNGQIEVSEMGLLSEADQAMVDASGLDMDLFYEIAANDSILIYNTAFKDISANVNYTFNNTKTAINYSDEFGQHNAIINSDGLLIVNFDDHKRTDSSGRPYRVFKKM